MDKKVSTPETTSKATVLHTSKRSRSSPQSDLQQTEKLCKMDAEALKEMMSKLLDDKMKILATKEDIESIRQQIAENTVQINDLKSENLALKDEVMKMRTLREADQHQLTWLEEQIKKKNVIIRGLQPDLSPDLAVKKLCNDILKIPDPLPIVAVRQLADRDGKMCVLVETCNGVVAENILKKSTMLAGTTISLEKDLSNAKLQQKKVMFVLKDQLIRYNKSIKVNVRNENIKIADKWFKWNKKNELECKGENTFVFLKALYNSDVTKHVTFNFNELLEAASTAVRSSAKKSAVVTEHSE